MRRVAVSVLALVLVLQVAGCRELEPEAPLAPGPEREGLTALDFRFEPAEVPVRRGQVTIRVTNAGSVDHNLSIAAIQADVDYKPGDSHNLIFVAPETGRLEFFCKYHRDRGMTGAFVVS